MGVVLKELRELAYPSAAAVASFIIVAAASLGTSIGLRLSRSFEQFDGRKSRH